jgi:hypothetical protein
MIVDRHLDQVPVLSDTTIAPGHGAVTWAECLPCAARGPRIRGAGCHGFESQDRRRDLP